MPTFLYNLIAKIRGPKPVESILSTFERTVKDLRHTSDDHIRAAGNKRQKARSLDAEADRHADEAHRAFTVANNINALIK